MIFVTVGTHEQQFNRLVKAMDLYAKDTNESVVIQSGFCTYIPKYAEFSKIYSYKKMNEFLDDARIVITHGGPASFIQVLQRKKIPIVVPRQCKYGEHVNDHQLSFCKEVDKRNKNIILVEDCSLLPKVISEFSSLTKDMNLESVYNNNKFNVEFSKIVFSLLDDNK